MGFYRDRKLKQPQNFYKYDEITVRKAEELAMVKWKHKEEMWEKNSFRDTIKNGQRCLIPVTGFSNGDGSIKPERSKFRIT